jgi:disulfide bond formation protein DsbB
VNPLARVGDEQLLAGGAAVALVATAGSLFLSEGWGLVPCRLCWYQRILMYPLVVVLGVATLEGRPGVARTALPLSVGGVAVSTYHSWLQVSAASGGCGLGGGCSAVQYRLEPLGLTVPNLALVAFLLVSVVGVLAWRRA